MCGCNKNKLPGTPEGAQAGVMASATTTPAHPAGNGNGNGNGAIQYTRITLRRDADVPILGIPLPNGLASYMNGNDVFFPKNRVTVVPGPVAHYLKTKHAELFL